MVRVQIKADSRYPIDRSAIRELVSGLLVDEGVSSSLVVSLAVVGNRKMRQLNQEYQGIDEPTDVLSFPYLDPQSNQDVGSFYIPESEGKILGDIVVSYPMAVDQAREKGILVDDEVSFLVQHGMEHLLGKHHD